MKTILPIVLLILLFLPVAPAAQGQPLEAPPVIDLTSPEISPDIKLALAGIIEKLRGNDAFAEGVTFDAAGRHKVGEEGFQYEGFDATGIAITGYTANVLPEGKALVVLEGIILFKDVIQRRTGTYFCAQYLAGKEGVSIQKSVSANLPPDFPRVESYIISEDLLRAGMGTLTTFADYYLYVIQNAEPMVYPEGGDSTGKSDKYYIITFSKDRLFDESDMKMTIKSRPNQRGNTLAKPVYLSDSGWRFMIAGGRFRPGSRSAKFYSTVTYKLDPEGYLPEVVVGEFENVKQESSAMAKAAQSGGQVPVPQPGTPAPAQEAQPAPVPVPQAKATPVPVPKPKAVPVPQPGKSDSMGKTTPPPAPKVAPKPAEGPLASGMAFLNPVFPEDVAIMQKRLKQLGYYKAKIDMEFGPLTKKALDRFAVRNGFPAGQWNMDLQKALFKGTGL